MIVHGVVRTVNVELPHRGLVLPLLQSHQVSIHAPRLRNTPQRSNDAHRFHALAMTPQKRQHLPAHRRLQEGQETFSGEGLDNSFKEEG